MTADIKENLKKVKAFKGCQEEFLEEVAQKVIVKKLSSGQNIITYGDSLKEVYISFSGLLEVTYFLSEGRKVTFDLLPPFRFFGEISSIDGKDRSASITTITDVRLGVVNYKFFKECMLRNHEFVFGLLADSAATIRKNNQQIVHLASADSKKKVIIQLLRLSKPPPDGKMGIKLVEGISHEIIASFLGLSRETVTRVISILKKGGLVIEVRKGKLSLDVEKISRYIELSEDELINW